MAKTVRFGVIGCGMMGREFASAAARWMHLDADLPRPEIIAACNRSAGKLEWFKKNVPTLRLATCDYRELLEREDVDAVYVAVPHALHEEIYIACLRAGKHLMGEKPFGMDKEQNDAIAAECAKHPELFVRCTSQFPYFPAAQIMIDWIRLGKFGRLIEVRSGLLHSSDLDLNKPINWKRMVKENGEYGCMGDLGIHAEHIPFRAGWRPKTVCAKLSKLVAKRPDGKGGVAECDTWDNATLLCDAEDADGNTFPMTFEMKRLFPGSTNDWYLEVYGMDMAAKISTGDAGAFHFTASWGKERAWSRISVGYKTMIPAITSPILEFGYPDSILQMWAAFMAEFDGRKVPFGCFSVEETRLSHALQTAALRSHAEARVVFICTGRGPKL
ncbi:MAG: Gfo/Idh/MocA family oxidoreductase [Planctomycetota bacterium]|jgi:predicted dehydrogenase|nr:Gfo/Idh/MocA family oxidoreductase [Planctomycetota bacterium]